MARKSTAPDARGIGRMTAPLSSHIPFCLFYTGEGGRQIQQTCRRWEEGTGRCRARPAQIAPWQPGGDDGVAAEPDRSAQLFRQHMGKVRRVECLH